jgi:hypothetical protein
MNFFDDNKESTEEVQKIKLGDQEFDPKELQELVSLGKLGKEAQDKFNTPIDKVYPEYTKATQKIKELEGAASELEQLKTQMAQQQAMSNAGFTPEQAETAKKQLYELMGGKPVTDRELEGWYQQRKTQDENVQNLLSNVDRVLADAKAEGKPEVDKKELLEYMQTNDFRNPATAYKEMKEAELDTWRSNKLTDAKRPGLHTVTNSMAGSKEPEKVKVTLDNLSALTREALGNEE